MSITGVAYSKRLIHLYTKNGHYFEKQWEVASVTDPSVIPDICSILKSSFSVQIDAHIGSVNDLAFSKPYGKFVVISCGDDKLIQVSSTVIKFNTSHKRYCPSIEFFSPRRSGMQ